jgi:hypothetical protein
MNVSGHKTTLEIQNPLLTLRILHGSLTGWYITISQALLFSHRAVLICLGINEAWNSSSDLKQGGNDDNLWGIIVAFA